MFFVLANWVMPLGADPLWSVLARTFRVSPGLTAPYLALHELENLFIALR